MYKILYNSMYKCFKSLEKGQEWNTAKCSQQRPLGRHKRRDGGWVFFFFNIFIILFDSSIFLFYFFYLFYLFLAVLGLRCCARAFSRCGERGLLFITVRRLLTVVASHWGAQALCTQASVVAACRLSSCGSWALERRLSSCGACA